MRKIALIYINLYSKKLTSWNMFFFFLFKDVNLILEFEHHISCPSSIHWWHQIQQNICALIYADKAIFTCAD